MIEARPDADDIRADVSRHNETPPGPTAPGVFHEKVLGGVLFSHGEAPHYHRR